MDNIRIAYIGGGSRGWAWKLMSDLADEDSISGKVSLYDIDSKAAKDNEIIGNSMLSRSDIKGRWKYEAVETLQEALKDANFVVISILPGTFDEMESDVHAPEKYGIYQSVGDSAGPGGLFRALRTVPMYIEIAKAIEKYSPEAWVINYTNPMTICTRTLYEVFPGIKAFGCCHEVFKTQELFASVLSELKGIDGIKRDEIKINVLGVNHFTWINSASYKNISLLPLYEKFVDKYYDEGYEGENKGRWEYDTFKCANRVKFDLFKRYGVAAAAGDRHLAEFVPGSWYLKDPDTVRSWKFGLTPVSWRKEDLKQRLEKSGKLVSGEEKVEITDTGEKGVQLIKALLGMGDIVTNVNAPNIGQMQGVPLGAVVETNALFTENGITPVASGKLPDNVQALVIRQVMNQETILKAALAKDKNMAFSAFVNDPLVNISLGDSKKLFDEMFTNTEKYLHGWK